MLDWKSRVDKFQDPDETGDRDFFDPATSWSEFNERRQEVSEGVKAGPHPITEGLGGPATKGASLVANSGKLLSKAPKILSGRKVVTGANVAKKTKNAAKSVDLAPRLASWGTSGESPVDVAQQTKDDLETAINAAKNWEAPDIDIPTPEDEPQPDQRAPVALLAAGAAVVGGAILLTQGGTRS